MVAKLTHLQKLRFTLSEPERKLLYAARNSSLDIQDFLEKYDE